MTTKLKALRLELEPKVLPEELAVLASVRAITYMHIEKGRTTTNKTGRKILVALNKLRVERGLEEVKLEDLGLTIA